MGSAAGRGWPGGDAVAAPVAAAGAAGGGGGAPRPRVGGCRRWRAPWAAAAPSVAAAAASVLLAAAVVAAPLQGGWAAAAGWVPPPAAGRLAVPHRRWAAGGAVTPAVADAAAAAAAAAATPSMSGWNRGLAGQGRGDRALALPAATGVKQAASSDYLTTALPRRSPGETYFYTQLALRLPATMTPSSAIVDLRRVMEAPLGGITADRIEPVRRKELPPPASGTQKEAVVSFFMALRPAELSAATVTAFNAWVTDGSASAALQRRTNSELYEVRLRRPLRRDEASVASHNAAGMPVPAGAATKRKSRTPVIIGAAVGGVVAVLLAVGGLLVCRSRRAASRGVTPRDLTRYSEEEGGRHSSFRSSIASLPLPSFRASLDRSHKVTPDEELGS